MLRYADSHNPILILLPPAIGIVIGVALYYLDIARLCLRRARLRAAGVYPVSGAETQADIERLLRQGHLEMAALCYKTIYKVTMQVAFSRTGAAKSRLKYIMVLSGTLMVFLGAMFVRFGFMPFLIYMIPLGAGFCGFCYFVIMRR